MAVHSRIRNIQANQEVLASTTVTFPNSAPQYYGLEVDVPQPDGDIAYNHLVIVANPSNATKITLSVRNEVEMFGDTVGAEVYNYETPAATYTAFSGDAWSSCFTDIGGNLLDESGDLNDTTGAKDVTFLFTAHDDAIYFGAPIPFSRARFVVDTAGVYVGTFAYEYWNGSAWHALDNVYDGSATAVNKPFTKLGSQYMQWTMPDDWAKLNPDGNPTEQYWVRLRVETLTSVTTNFTLENGLYKATGDANVHAYIVPGMFNPGDCKIVLKLSSGLSATQGFPAEVAVYAI